MPQTALPPRVEFTRTRLFELLGTMTEGQSLPSERDLCMRWDVSRVTLRRAMDDFVVGGVLTRRRGAGTYLTRPRLSRRLAMTSFTEDMRRRGKVPSTRTLRFRRRSADRALSQKLRVPIGEEVLSFSRLRLADDEPMAVETSSIARSLVPGLTAADLEGSWYELLAERYGIHIENFSFDVIPVLPEPQMAEWLSITQAQPCLRLTSLSLDGRGRMIEAGEATYRGDTYTLSAELSTVQPNPLHSPSPFA